MSIFDRLKAAGVDMSTPVAPPASQYTAMDRLGRTSVAVPSHLLLNPEPEKTRLGKQAVAHSHDLARILELPRRTLDPADGRFAQKWTRLLRNSTPTVGCTCEADWGFCIHDLLPIQGSGCEEGNLARGLLGLLGVGSGKTGLDILLPLVVPECRVALLLIPPNLKAQFLQRDFPQWSRHFRVPNLAGGRTFEAGIPVLHVVAYSELSNAKATDLIKRVRPDLIIADEAHNISRRDAARTKRFLRHFTDFPKTRFVALSGTLTSRSLQDYAHLAGLALHEGSPLPLHWPTVEEWAGAIDAEKTTTIAAPIGALRKLCNPGEHVREGFRRRLTETSGVVATQEGVLGTSLYLQERTLKVPACVDAALQGVRMTWQRPDGEELTDALTKAAVCRQLACGFYYRWIWPRGEPLPVRETWLKARRDWHREIREKLKHSREHMDSPLLLTRAAARWHEGFNEITDEGRKVEHPPHTKHRMTWASDCYLEWQRVKESAEPQTEAVWVDDYLIQDAGAWAQANVGLVWYTHAAFGERLASQAGLPFFGPGNEANVALLKERGDRSIVVSAKAHATGKNLQAWNHNLICNPSTSGKDWEQLLGRTHRTGQRADEVFAEVYRQTEEMREALDQAMRDARYVAQSTGQQQKLIYANRDW